MAKRVQIDSNQIIKLYESGLSAQKIANQFGVSESLISKKIN